MEGFIQVEKANADKKLVRCVLPGRKDTPFFTGATIKQFEPCIASLIKAKVFKPMLTAVHVLDVHNVLDMFAETDREIPFLALPGLQVAVSWVGNVEGALAESMVPELRNRMRNGQIAFGIICSTRGKRPRRKKGEKRGDCELGRATCLAPGSKAHIIQTLVETVSTLAKPEHVCPYTGLVPATFFDDAEDHVVSANEAAVATLHTFIVPRMSEAEVQKRFEGIVVQAVGVFSRQCKEMLDDRHQLAQADGHETGEEETGERVVKRSRVAGNTVLPFGEPTVVYEHSFKTRLLTIGVPEYYHNLLRACTKIAKPFADFIQIIVAGRKATQSRKTAFFGPAEIIGYNYSGQTTEAIPMPGSLAKLTALINTQFNTEFNGILFNWYEAGSVSCIGFHSDQTPHPDFPLAKVVSISVGAPRTFRLKDRCSRETVFDFETGPFELMCMDGARFQDELVHGIPKKVGAGERFSFTFRRHPTVMDMETEEEWDN